MPRLRPITVRLVAAATVLVAAALLALLGGHGSGSVAAPATSSTTADTGRRVFLRDCAWCHGTDGAGTNNGPSLVDVGAQAADFYLRTGRMPLSSPDAPVKGGEPAYGDATISALVQYVGSLGHGPAVPPVAAGDPVRGRTLFLQNCAACHSASGTGTILSTGQQAPDLWHTADQQVGEAIRIGPGPMPPFGPHQLADRDVDDVVAYVHELGPKQARGGAGLDQYGPILEGIVVLLVLLPAALLVVRLLGKRAPEGEK